MRTIKEGIYSGLDEAITTGHTDQQYLLWEYQVVYAGISERDLNDLMGINGWELVGIDPNQDRYIFKRPKVDRGPTTPENLERATVDRERSKS